MHGPGIHDASPPLARPWCLFRCGQTGYAIGLESVAEVVEVDRLVRLPLSPPRVLGLCTLRRELIPVVALNDPTADPPAQPSPTARALVLILRTPPGTWAVRINAEGTIVTEEGLDEAGAANGSCAIVRRGETSYAVVDPEETWQALRESVENWYRGHTRTG